MYNFDNAHLYIDKNFILSKINEYDIFLKYCSKFKQISKSFCSELRSDNNPDCRIGYYQGSLFYKDFATGESYNCFSYIMKKYGCNYQESLNIIAGDFNLLNYNKQCIIPVINDNLTKSLMENKEKTKTLIEIYPREFIWYDCHYWSKYHINRKLLNEYNVIPIKYAIITKENKRYTIENKIVNPAYAYKFDNSYKIYRPLAQKKDKWLFNGKKTDIEGYDNLPHLADLLIITKSLKDVICLKLLDIPAISLQGEQNPLSRETYNILSYRFKEIVVLYDPDECGIKGAEKLCLEYGFKSILIPFQYKSKDISDLLTKVSINEAKSIINKELEQCMKQ